MKINQIGDVANTNDIFLDVSKLVEGLIYERVALVISANAGTTKTNSGFARFYLKDINSNVVCARLFDVKDFVSCGINLAEFKNRPVKLRFIAQGFNGGLSLIVDGEYGIKSYDGDFDRSKFIGSYSFNSDVIELFARDCGMPADWTLPVEYKVASFQEIGQGRVGAFAKMVEICSRCLSGYLALDGVDRDELAQAFFVTIECYYRLLKAKEVYGFLEDIKAFDIVSGIDTMSYNKELKAIVLDCVRPLAGFGHPKHLFSHLINNSINNAIANLDLVLCNNQLIVGASTKIGGVSLSKF